MLGLRVPTTLLQCVTTCCAPVCKAADLGRKVFFGLRNARMASLGISKRALRRRKRHLRTRTSPARRQCITHHLRNRPGSVVSTVTVL